MSQSASQVLWREQSQRISFKKWLLREYSDRSLMGHPSWQLALEIEAKWPDFPEEGNYLELSIWLSDHGACNRCLQSFMNAWGNYINDA